MYIEKDSVRAFLRLPPSAVFFLEAVFFGGIVMGWVVVESAMCVGLRAPAAAARRGLDRRGSNLSILAERGSIVRSRTENRKKGVGTATGTLILEKAWAGCPCVSVCDRRGNAAAAKGSPRACMSRGAPTDGWP